MQIRTHFGDPKAQKQSKQCLPKGNSIEESLELQAESPFGGNTNPTGDGTQEEGRNILISYSKRTAQAQRLALLSS
jgi:hypothetical protein